LLITFQVMQFQAAHLLVKELTARAAESHEQFHDRRLVNAGHSRNRADRGSFDQVMQHENLIVG